MRTKQIRSVWSILKWSSPGFWPTSSVFLIWYHVRQGHRSCWRQLKCQLKTSRTGNDFRGWVKTCQNLFLPYFGEHPEISINGLVCWGNLNRKPWFLPLDMGVSCKFSLKPILWWWVFPLKMVIFHSYVSLPEGIQKKQRAVLGYLSGTESFEIDGVMASRKMSGFLWRVLQERPAGCRKNHIYRGCSQGPTSG